MSTKRGVAGWVLYDVANTIFSLNVTSLYFGIWVVSVMGGRDSDYAIASSVSMLVIFALSPLLGAITDLAGRRLPALAIATAGCVGLTMVLGSGGLLVSLIAFAIANVAYQAGLQFYDSLLPEVSTEKTRGRIGGMGIGFGYLGAVIGITVGSAILGDWHAAPADEVLRRYRRVFIATGALFLILAIPLFLFLRERPRPSSPIRLGDASRRVAETFRSARRYPGLVRFLVARTFYTDAAGTVIRFMGIYVTTEVGLPAAQEQLVLTVAIAGAAAGGFAWGPIVDRLGPLRTLRIVLVLWLVTFAWATAVGLLKLPPVTFWPVPLLAGLALGGTWCADRPILLRLAPPDRIGEFFGLYGMVGRFSAVVGPLVWALIVDGLGWGRPIAVGSLLVFVVVAMVLLSPLTLPDQDGIVSGSESS